MFTTIVADAIHLGFDIKYRRQVALVELHHMAEELCLFLGAALGGEEVIGPTDDAVFACLMEVVVEVGVELVRTFRSLDEYKADRCTLYVGITNFLPVDVLLIMTDVDTAYGTGRVVGISVNGFPSERIWPNECLVEENDIHHDNQDE